MRYYPLSKVKTNLKAKSGELKLNGKPYTGYYYLTYDGKIFPGRNPIVGSSTPLSYVSEEVKNENVKSSSAKAVQKQKNETKEYNIPTFGNFIPYIPVPTEEDYRKGFILRYFSKKFNDKASIIEISKDQHEDFLGNNDSGFDTVLYKVTSMFWQISGPLNDVQKTQFNKIRGIEDTNKRLTEEREKEFPGIITYIGKEYSKFAIPT